jgi:demethylmenaquinone methyltransferase/2-methoxy-6-polyprenyl-1,4-benzoquinol methylase
MADEQSTQRILSIYDFAAIGYDFEATLTGFSAKSRIRREAIGSLEIKKDQLVIDACCGTGLNFELLERHLGDGGKIIGVDLNSNMLRVAKRRCDRKDWSNVELVNANVLEFNPGKLADGALCTIAMGTIPEYERAIDHLAKQLKPGGRFSIVDGKLSDRFPHRLLNRPYDLFAKSGGFDMKNRDLIAHIRSRYEVVFYREYAGGFYYTITFVRN